MHPFLRLKLAVYATLFTLASLAGCATPTFAPPGGTYHTVLVGSADIADWINEWSTEVRQRYANAVIVFAHGVDRGGMWFSEPSIGNPISVEKLIDNIREIHPTRRIVLVMCNPGKHKISAPGVTYARNNVWVVPDRVIGDFSKFMRAMTEPDFLGGIYEFTENP